MRPINLASLSLCLFAAASLTACTPTRTASATEIELGATIATDFEIEDDGTIKPKRRKVTIDDPGYFDVGVGVGVVTSAGPGPGNDASGLMSNIKAYPVGRWYTSDGDGNLRVVEDRCEWYYRFSVAYGISSDSFSGQTVNTPVHHLALGFDVSPELAILVGGALYEGAGDNPDTDFAPFFGVSLNLNAFATLLRKD